VEDDTNNNYNHPKPQQNRQRRTSLEVSENGIDSDIVSFPSIQKGK